MSSRTGDHEDDYLDLVFQYALQALPSSEVPAVEAHLSMCEECRREIETLQPIIGTFVSWPTDVLRPSSSLWQRLAQRIAAETGQEPVMPTPQTGAESDWE
jgi:anti-sigma factor ChrR (cupin superfamily)